MYIVMGATGHVGSAVAETLLALGEPVGIITHDPEHADSWRDTNAEIIEADVNDVPSLRAASALNAIGLSTSSCVRFLRPVI